MPKSDQSGFEYFRYAECNRYALKCSIGARSLISLDLRFFDTQNAMNMSYMFFECQSMTNLDLNSFDTQNVTDMSYMFSECQGLTSLDLSSFDTQM